MHKQKLPAALPAGCPAVEQPQETSGQQTKQKEREHDLQDAMTPLLTLARP